MLYPFKLQPIYKEPIWGGNKLRERFGKNIPSDSTGESWEVACHPNGTSIIGNGVLKGKSLAQVLDMYGIDILGRRVGGQGVNKFPLLVKILDATDKLSVQVHPEDKYAFENENGEFGKTEMWYVIDAEPGAQLVYGVKSGTTKEQFKNAIVEGNLEKYLNFVEVKPGDVFFMPATTLHAIGAGLLVAEIQQNSDTTYRVYDWNRVDSNGNARQLHVEKALDVTDFSDVTGREKVEGLSIHDGKNLRTYLIACEYFAVEKIEVIDISHECIDGEKFDVLMVLKGEGQIIYDEGEQDFKSGDSFLIPACMGNYSIKGCCSIIKGYVPNILEDIIKPLRNKGITEQELAKIAGL